MSKEKFKRLLLISLIIFIGLALAITYFFVLYKKDNISQSISAVVSIMRPFTIGAILAYIMKSTCNFYEKHLSKKLLQSKKLDEKQAIKRSNIIAVVLTYITWSAILTALLWIIIPQIVQSVKKFINDMIVIIPEWVDRIFEWEQTFLEDNEILRPYFDSIVNWLITWSETELIPDLRDFGASLVPTILSIITIIKDIAIGLVVSVFFLSGRKIFAVKSRIFVNCIFKENAANAIIDEVKYADKMFSGFLEGKVIDSSIIGLIYYLALVIMGVPYPALIAVICGVTNIIPFFGPFIGAVPSGLIILMTADSPIKLLWFIIFVCVIQFIDGNIIDPHIVGGNIKMSSFCVLFAVILFGGLWGFWGLLVGVPTFAVIYDIVKKIIMYVLKKKDKTYLIENYYEEFGKKSGKKKSNKKKSSGKKSGEKNESDPTVTVVAEDGQAIDPESAENQTVTDEADEADSEKSDSENEPPVEETESEK